ncbi:hypothetical protein V7O62_12295 [Methanolobus sp. ZRKC2]|uniref:hypothetical protein n=1 Tax=Methanolobus sp. ZRKC2 TaxID=3125783 RepID=UPI0032443B61
MALDLLLQSFLNLILYAILSVIDFIFGGIHEIIMQIWTAFAELYQAFYGLIMSVVGLFTDFLGALLPSAWFALMLITMLVVFVLRVYHFLKDVSIAGFKI